MSNSKLHKQKGRFKNGSKNIPLKLKKHFDRHNSDKGYYRKIKLDLKNKIFKREFKHTVESLTIDFVMSNRSNAYEFIDFENLEQYNK